MYSLSFQFKTKHIAFGRLSLAHEPAVLLSGACLPNLKEAMSTKPTSSPRYSLTYYESRNSKSLRVIHWGPGVLSGPDITCRSLKRNTAKSLTDIICAKQNMKNYLLTTVLDSKGIRADCKAKMRELLQSVETYRSH